MKAYSKLRSGSDRDLIEQTGRGNRQALAELINRYSKRVHAIAYQVVRNSEDAQDIAQEVFVRMYQSLCGYDPHCRFSHWLFRITINLAIDWLRSKKNRDQKLRDNKLFNDSRNYINADKIAESNQLKNIIHRISRQLPDKQLQVFILRDLEELTVAEISEIMQCKASTVRVHLAKARIYIREKIKTEYPEFIIDDKRAENEL